MPPPRQGLRRIRCNRSRMAPRRPSQTSDQTPQNIDPFLSQTLRTADTIQ
jgi:hypothetical protein